MLPLEVGRDGTAEEFGFSRYAPVDRNGRDIRCRFNSKAPDTPANEVLEEVSVVAGKLDDERMLVQSETLRHGLNVSLCVRYPTIGIGREVGIVTEDVLRRHELLQLNQSADVAHVGM